MRELAESNREVGYDLDEWNDPERGQFIEQLVRKGVRHRFAGGTVVVSSADEALVDRIVAELGEDAFAATLTEGPSACCLLYLFADEVVRPSTLWSRLDSRLGIPVPCGRKPVQLGVFERLVFAWALWDLQENGLIQLNGAREAEDDSSSRDIAVRSSGLRATTSGLSAEVLGACRSEGEPIATIVRRWAADHIPLPLYAVVRTLQREAASFGLLELSAHDQKVDPFVDYRPKRSASEDCERIATLEPRFQDLAARWRSFAAEEARRAVALEEQCRWALFDLRPPPIAWIGPGPVM